MKRFALEFLLPPFLASLPLGVSTAWAASQGGEISPVVVFAAFVGLGFVLAAIPSLLSAFLAEATHLRTKKSSGWWVLFGLLAGVVVSKVWLEGDLLVVTAVIFAVAWGVTGLLVGMMETPAPRKTVRSSVERPHYLPPGSPAM